MMRLRRTACPWMPALCSVLLVSCAALAPVQSEQPAARLPRGQRIAKFLDAAAEGDLETVRAALGQDPGLLDREEDTGWDALHYAAWESQALVHEYLLQQGARGNLFTEAALGPWESFIERLQTNPIAADSRDGKRKATPLIWAARSGNQAGCELLFSMGADVLARDREGNAALHHAILMGRLELVDFLLAAGADVDAGNERGQTALHLAVQAGSFTACQKLLERGAGLQAADNQGNTPLHLAALRGSFELCEFLLFSGASPTVENGAGLTPRQLAAEADHAPVVRLLEAQGG